MNLEHLLLTVLAGGLMGLLGQGIRAAVGMKKLHDTAAESNTTFSDKFSASGFTTSLFLGFIVGALTLLLMPKETVVASTDGVLSVERDVLLGLVAVGYSATDFIEGLTKRLLPYQTALGSLKK